MVWTLYLEIRNGHYEIVLGGSNIVPTKSYDKVLQTTERIARQFDKVYFDGEHLRLKEGEELLTIEELNAKRLEGLPDNPIANPTGAVYDVVI
ncbi:hypothetical protein [Staphylococcus simulans]|uniref:hypothetical protein n=1 Tax=Staphylococcus simulans TaxID=1286 RepID=UPI000D1D3B41|nr:hypothetical protein [Staphylococcus simulans]PTJ14045.1 hypothetical protein BU040_00100 [Staphylococcus simulans]PTJ32887.1 hypothetical protein BU027_10285 [Staphylococcus simulans]PTJ42135.1 hypothetical protein BU022_08590 [Staphylococcus simulans]PTJ76048.1 hypothetical protein BU050_09250 [Staphylococcus simulans]PTJ85166.1 hypothetical protein BU051_09055 [Staphylococcus simulans]